MLHVPRLFTYRDVLLHVLSGSWHTRVNCPLAEVVWLVPTNPLRHARQRCVRPVASAAAHSWHPVSAYEQFMHILSVRSKYCAFVGHVGVAVVVEFVVLPPVDVVDDVVFSTHVLLIGTSTSPSRHL